MELIKALGLEPVVFSKTQDFGAWTIIEKLEHITRDVEFAIVILTPDDVSPTGLPSQEKYRARQNVVFEMGWSFAKWGRGRTLLLLGGKRSDKLELPTNIDGVLYNRFRRTPKELTDKIRKTLIAGGVAIPKKRPRRARAAPKPPARTK